MSDQSTPNIAHSSKMGFLKVILILCLNAIAIHLYCVYVLYPISDITDIQTAVPETADMNLINHKTFLHNSVYVFEGLNDQPYVVTIEKSFIGERFRTLKDGTFYISEELPITFRTKTIVGILECKISENLEVEEIFPYRNQTLKTVSGVYLTVFVLLSVAEFLLWKFIPRKKKNK